MCATTNAAIASFLLLVTVAAPKSHRCSSSSVFAEAAVPPNQNSYQQLQAKSRNHYLNIIGDKFESTAIATHYTIIQKAKEENDNEQLSATSTPSSMPTMITYNPTALVGGDVIGTLATDVPTSTPTAMLENGKDSSRIEGHDVSSSPSSVPSAYSTFPNQTSSLTPTTDVVEQLYSPTPSSITTAFSTNSTVLAEKEHSTPTPSPIPPTNQQECPELFDKAAFYLEGDIISTKGPLFCRSKVCRIIYKCHIESFCNVVTPGKEYSDEGWLEIGRCGNDAKFNEGIDLELEEEQDIGVIPSSHPTKWYFGVNPAMVTTPEEDNQDKLHSIITSVKIPSIICDISLASSLAKDFEQTQVLLVVMTKSIYGIFESYLSNELGLTGISLNVSTENSTLSSSTTRVQAFFTGTASFSHFAPTQSELIDLLLLHFDVAEFNHELEFPLRLRTLGYPSVKVNSVFVTLEDGSIVNAGYKNVEERTLPPNAQDRNAGLSMRNVQIITVALVVVALPFVLVATVLVVLRYNDEHEMDYIEADDESIPAQDSVKHDVEEDPPAPTNNEETELNDPVTTTIEPSVEIEIDVPLSPISRAPLSDISESQSEWSSISGSLHDCYIRDIESPSNIKTGLGISAAGHHVCEKKSPYDGQVDAMSLMSALWDHRDDEEVYEDYIIDV